MKKKIITGLVLGFGILITIGYGGWALFAVTMFGGVTGMWEYYELLKKKGIQPMTVFGIIAGASFITVAFCSMYSEWESKKAPAIFGTVVTFFVLIVLVTQFVMLVQRRHKYSILDLAVTVFGSIYIGGFMSFVLLLMSFGIIQFPDNTFLSRLPLFIAMFASWGADTGAYFTGSFLGKTKIFAEISPNKTLEGFVGGVIASTVGVALLGLAIQIPLFHGILLGMFAGAIGQVGDLSESAFKREVGIKDSGSIFGTHGGLLDRVDSFLFTLPVVYYYFVWFCPWTK